MTLDPLARDPEVVPGPEKQLKPAWPAHEHLKQLPREAPPWSQPAALRPLSSAQERQQGTVPFEEGCAIASRRRVSAAWGQGHGTRSPRSGTRFSSCQCCTSPMERHRPGSPLPTALSSLSSSSPQSAERAAQQRNQALPIQPAAGDRRDSGVRQQDEPSSRSNARHHGSAADRGAVHAGLFAGGSCPNRQPWAAIQPLYADQRPWTRCSDQPAGWGSGPEPSSGRQGRFLNQ